MCLSTLGISCLSGTSVVMVNFERIVQPPYEQNNFDNLVFFMYWNYF